MHFTKTLLSLGVFAAAAASLQAQCYEANTGASIGSGDDVVLPQQALGFAFSFGGATYTDIHVSTNGLVHLSNAGVPAHSGAHCCSGDSATLVATTPKIAPYWSDLVVPAASAVKFNALPGKAVITWENAYEYGDVAQNLFSVQLQLLQSGEIYFAYDGRCSIRTAGDFLIGMSEGSGAAVPAPSDLSVVGVSGTTTLFEIFNNTGLAYDLAGQTLQFVPTGPTGYAWVPTACASAHANYGQGCYTVASSVYELFPTNAIDLANSSMTLLFTGNGYTAIPGLTQYVAPSGAATSLVLGDDAQTTVTLPSPFVYAGGATTTMSVCSNGYISVDATGNGTAFTPVSATMVAAPFAGFWIWHDLNPSLAGSGQVKFEVVGSTAYITWDGVYSYNTSNPETFQFQLDLTTGSVTFAFGTLGGFGNGWLVGYSGGGPSAGDPGSIDLSAALPATIPVPGNDLLPLALSAAPLPLAGSTVTYTTTNIPQFVPASGLYVAITILSIGQVAAPGLDLGFLGAPGCPALVQSLDLTLATIGATPTLTSTFTYPASVPTGLQIFAQAAALFAPNSLPNGQNAFGLSTSNGVASTVGIW
jgi:hypothetical protein